MADRGVRRVQRPGGMLAVPVTVLAVALVVSVVLWTRGTLNPLICDGDCGPAYVTAPDSLTDSSTPADVSPNGAPTGSLDANKVEAAVDDALGDDALGGHVGLVVMGATGEVLVSKGSGTYVPASTAKLLTGFAALQTIGPQTRFTTSVVSSGDKLVLVGGGDPYLLTKLPKKPDRAFRATLTTLAARTAAVLKRDNVSKVSLGFDASLFSGPSASPDWKADYVTGNIVTPVSALWTDQGVVGGLRAANPAASAARIFAGLLEDRGIDVSGDPDPVQAPRGVTPVAAVQSATLAQIVSAMVRTSDNQTAEVLFRQIAIASKRPGSFDGGSAAVTEVLKKASIDTDGLELHDGSGLSRADRISPATLAQTVMAALAGLPTAGLLSDLPVSGFSGTLASRFSKSKEAYGLVRAKTGTLTGVHSLAGYALDADGLPVVFALMSDGNPDVDLVSAEVALDRVAAAITTCSCGTS